MRARNPNALDRAIEWAFPGWALRRAEARHRLGGESALTPGYDAGQTNRLRNRYRGRDATADALLAYGVLEEMRERSRDLVRNDPIAGSAVRAIVDNVVGKGLVPHAKVDPDALGISTDQAAEWNALADQAWQRWAPHAMTDGTGIYAGQALAMRRIIEDGEALVRPVMSRQRHRPYEFALQALEADRLQDPIGGGTGATLRRDNLRMGVELGREQQPVAYWLRDRHPGDVGFGTARRSFTFRKVPAYARDGSRNLYHVYRRLRTPQSRGVPALAPATSDLQDLADIIEAEREAQRVMACFTGYITKPAAVQAAIGAAAGKQDADGRRLEEMEPGIFEYLEPGEEITFGDPKRPASTFASFVEHLERRIGASVGLPYEFLLLNFAKISYSSYRGSGIEAWRGFECWQGLLITDFLAWARGELLKEIYLKGGFPAWVDLAARPELWHAAQWNGPTWKSVDPTKDAAATKLELEQGITSPQEEMRRRGRDPERIREEREQWAAAEETTEPSTAEPGGDPAATSDAVKASVDAYGAAVRAGVVTPQREDEKHYRAELGVPGASRLVDNAWEREGVRRPVTLAAPADNPAEQQADKVPDDPDDDDQAAAAAAADLEPAHA